MTTHHGGSSELEQNDSGVLKAAKRPGSAKSAEEEAFTALMATAERPVFLNAMSLLHHANDAEEVLQRTRMILWEKFSQYERGTNFIGWACTIARFEALTLRKELRREKPVFRDAFLDMLACETEKSLDILEDRRQALKKCLDKLRPGDRDLILRRYQRDATTRSVAKELNRSPQGTRRALQRLREALAECVRRTLALEDSP